MSKPKIWTLPELLDRIWMLSRGKRTAVATGKPVETIFGPGLDNVSVKRVVTGWDEDYKPRTYELNKISAASAAALYERIKTMRGEESKRRKDVHRVEIEAFERGQVYALELVEKAYPELGPGIWL